MNDVQRRHFNMGGTVLEGLDNHDFFSANAGAVAKRDELEDNLNTIEQADGQQIATSGTGQSTSKAVVKHALADQAEPIANGVCLLALSNNDLVTFAKYHKTLAQLTKMSDVDLLAFCNDLYGYANPIAASLAPFNVTPGQIANFLTQITAFTDVRNAPQENIGDHRAATLDVVGGLVSMNDTLHWWDLFMGTVRTTEPDVYAAYHTWRKINDSGVRHISIRGLVTASDSGTKLYRAKITITNLAAPKIAFSGKFGTYRFFSLEPGDYTLQVEMTGYQTLTIPVVSVAEGQITDFNIALVKI